MVVESTYANRYWSDLKRKLAQEAGSEQPYEKIVRLKLTAPDGKQRDTDCAEAETLLRIVQSIPSPKAEPIKLWLAKVGYERMQEMADSTLSLDRARQTWQQHGRSDSLPSSNPIPWPAALVGDGEHSDKFAIHAEEQSVREALEMQTLGAVQAGAADTGLLHCKVHNAFQLLRERTAWRCSAVVTVPAGCLFGFRQGFGIE